MADGRARFTIHVPGRPVGKGRPRFGNGRTFTPHLTMVAENDIRAAWQAAGSPRLDGPIALTVRLELARPQSHYTTKGALSAVGRRMPYPHRQKPDLDNASKLVCDSLNGLAWRDDVQIVMLAAFRVWGDVPGTTIRAREVDEL